MKGSPEGTSRVGELTLAWSVSTRIVQVDCGLPLESCGVDPFSTRSPAAEILERAKTVALVVFLRGVNVGGHRTFKPTELTRQLKHLDALNIGAAGTFVIRQPIPQAELRAELARRLQFETEIVLCQGREITSLVSRDPFAGQPVSSEIVRFVSVLSRRPASPPSLPIDLPSKGAWLLRILARDQRFVLGLYRRQMKAIGYLGTLDRLFGVPVTTRNWNTITAIAKALEDKQARTKPAGKRKAN